MIQRLFLTCLSLTALLASGCLFSKKPAQPKESSAIASSVEESFKVRWIDKRVGDLVAQGKAADAARAQATDEFRERFAYTGGVPKK